MGVTPEQLAAAYPLLYHMAEQGSWDSIRGLGLLSTSALLDKFEVPATDRFAIEGARRPDCVSVVHPVHGRAVVRDQSVLHESKLEKSLTDCTLKEWYMFLNERVFFWLDEERLKTLMGAKNYRDRVHTVLILDTKSLATDYADQITLSPMNSGNTVPIAHQRGRATFLPMKEYPFEERRHRGSYYQVVELAVLGGVQGIQKYILEVKDCSVTDRKFQIHKVRYPR